MFWRSDKTIAPGSGIKFTGSFLNSGSRGRRQFISVRGVKCVLDMFPCVIECFIVLRLIAIVFDPAIIYIILI